MRKNNKFERTSKGGVVFACAICGRNTRLAGQGNDELCNECWELAGLDNHVNDGGNLSDVIKERDALLRTAAARGGDEAAIMASCDYLWPKKPRVGFHTGLSGGDELFPDFCLVKNRKALTPEQQAKLDTQAVKQQPERVDGRKPKGMSWEDWDACNKPAAATSETTVALPKPRGTSTRKASGLLDAHYFAKLCGCEAKVVRRALRSQKKPFAVAKPAAGWVFPKEQETEVVAVVTLYLGKGNLDWPEGFKPKKPVKAKSADPQVDATLRAAFNTSLRGKNAVTKAKRARK